MQVGGGLLGEQRAGGRAGEQAQLAGEGGGVVVGQAEDLPGPGGQGLTGLVGLEPADPGEVHPPRGAGKGPGQGRP